MSKQTLEFEMQAIYKTVELNLKKDHNYIHRVILKETVFEYIRNILIEMQNDDIIIYGLSKEYEKAYTDFEKLIKKEG